MRKEMTAQLALAQFLFTLAASQQASDKETNSGSTPTDMFLAGTVFGLFIAVMFAALYQCCNKKEPEAAVVGVPVENHNYGQVGDVARQEHQHQRTLSL